VGLDASSALRADGWDRVEPRPLLRAKTPDDLAAYLAGPQPPETAWLTGEQQHEEAWFLGLRLNAGVDLGRLEEEFGRETVEPAMAVVDRMVHDNLLAFSGKCVRLTARGRMISNEVFQEFIGLEQLSTQSAG
jgi:oxygen-independent coproporphyrinogen-3 oxidase